MYQTHRKSTRCCVLVLLYVRAHLPLLAGVLRLQVVNLELLWWLVNAEIHQKHRLAHGFRKALMICCGTVCTAAGCDCCSLRRM